MLDVGFSHWGMEASVMASIFSLRDLGTSVVPWLFPEGGVIGFGTSDGSLWQWWHLLSLL